MSVINEYDVDVEPVIDDNADELVYLGIPMRITIVRLSLFHLLQLHVRSPSRGVAGSAGSTSHLPLVFGFSPLAELRSVTTATSPTDHSRPIVA